MIKVTTGRVLKTWYSFLGFVDGHTQMHYLYCFTYTLERLGFRHLKESIPVGQHLRKIPNVQIDWIIAEIRLNSTWFGLFHMKIFYSWHNITWVENWKNGNFNIHLGLPFVNIILSPNDCTSHLLPTSCKALLLQQVEYTKIPSINYQ